MAKKIEYRDWVDRSFRCGEDMVAYNGKLRASKNKERKALGLAMKDAILSMGDNDQGAREQRRIKFTKILPLLVSQLKTDSSEALKSIWTIIINNGADATVINPADIEPYLKTSDLRDFAFRILVHVQIQNKNADAILAKLKEDKSFLTALSEELRNSGGQYDQSPFVSILATLKEPKKAEPKRKFNGPKYVPINEANSKGKSSSWFGPTAFLLKNEKLPRCQSCEEKLSPLLQIELSSGSEFFETAKKGSYLQVFYCLNENCDEYAAMDDETADNFLVRIIENPLKTKVKGPVEFEEQLFTLGKPIADNKDEPITDDKIGGLPAWIQQQSYSRCAKCRTAKNMKYRMQYTFGDVEGLPFPQYSSIFISQCTKHPDQLGMIYQSS